MDVITAKNLSKKFNLEFDKQPSVLARILGVFSGRRRKREFLVIDDLSMRVRKGDFVGIIGRNASGKSTLLRTLAGIYPFDSGSLEIKGKVATVLELDLGLNPRLTLKENVYFSCSLLGMSKKEIDRKLDSILNFSELGDYLNVKLYKFSSGMEARLAFAIAIHQDFDILLIDEVISAGDAAFVEKCKEKILEFKRQGKTILFVTHRPDLSLCDRIIWIDRGKVIREGRRNVLNKYLRTCRKDKDLRSDHTFHSTGKGNIIPRI